MRLPFLARMLVLLAAVVCGQPAAAATYRGIVTHVSDGDTLWVRPDGQGKAVAIRLLGIDAPEGCQPGGPQATRALAARILRQRVEVRTRGADDYHRALAVVRHRNQDIGAWLVREGHAWSTGFRGRPGRYERQQDQARAERRGLWAGPHAVEPRHFRRAHGRCA